MGFIFYGKSPRFVGEAGVDVLSDIPASIYKTAVFVDESVEVINALIEKYNFDAIQLHGHESAEFCAYFKDKVKVIKAFGLNEDFDFNQLHDYMGNIDFFLFDTKTPVHGGSGKTFNWDILSDYKLNIPFFLSGGLALENMEEIKSIRHPQFYGIDLNSRFERSPAMKDINKLEKAFDIIKQTTNALRS
jgi:phosphoribosylanthranilate isomerase